MADRKTMEIEVTPETLVKISYGAIVFAISVVFGFAVWMTVQDVRGQTLAAEVVDLRVEQKTSFSSFLSFQRDQIEILHKIDKRLDRIEHKLGGQ